MHNNQVPPGRPPKNGKTGKRWNIYCTDDDRALVRSILALNADQKAYVAQWIAKGAFVKGEKKP